MTSVVCFESPLQMWYESNFGIEEFLSELYFGKFEFRR